MHILGTAGHVDHGKSSLVRALTGTNPDRWLEEQVRGMTLDLGFAHLRFPDGVEAGIVDVPGHERFLHNMLAGAAGMELLLLVVAANEGPRPQTLEHLAILDYLNVRRTLIVLTKSDLVDEEELAFTEELTREAVAGSIADGAPVIGVSTFTGAGLDTLRNAIHEALAALAPRLPSAPVFLPVDRVFALAGHGTIVTGTLMQGTLAVGDQLVLQPSGREVRVRSVQVFGERRDRVSGGARVAANIPGIEVGEIARGEVLASPSFSAQASLEVEFTPLPAALEMMRRRTRVRAYLGSAEVLGTLVLDEAPASAAVVKGALVLRRPVAVFPGEAFVLRRLSPKDLLGGGTVAGAHAGGDETDTDDPEQAAVLRVLSAAGLAALPSAKIAAVANVREDRLDTALAELVGDGRVRKVNKPVAYVDALASAGLLERVDVALREAHKTAPWAMGLTSLALARTLATDESLLVRILASAVEEGELVYRGGYYATLDFTPQLTDAQRAFFETAIPIDPAQPCLPASLPDVVNAMKHARIDGLSAAFDMLVATGAAVKVGETLYRGTQIADIRAKLETALRRDKEITAAAFRDLVGTSRKYTIPLLEWFDSSGITVRSGDVRMLRAKAAVAKAGA